MKSKLDTYKDGMIYEAFMHRAFKSPDTSKPGRHCSVIQNLVRVEQGDTFFVKWHGTYEKQFEKVKYYMHKAMSKYLKMKKIPPENLILIEGLNLKIDKATNTDDLLSIVEETIELTQSVKDY